MADESLCFIGVGDRRLSRRLRGDVASPTKYPLFVGELVLCGRGPAGVPGLFFEQQVDRAIAREKTRINIPCQCSRVVGEFLGQVFG